MTIPTTTSHSQNLNEKTGYTVTQQLYRGSRTEVFRAYRKQDEQAVILKVLNHQHPDLKELIQFRNQYVISRNLEHPNLTIPLALERYQNSYILVLPDEDCVSLADYWGRHPSPQNRLYSALDIALQLADVLRYLSEQGIIHKDIKPKNVLIHPATGQIKLIDFSIASLLPKEKPQLESPNIIEGTLAYISPEQTGRMNRGIDYRSDFYSLGVTLFELLVGHLPYEMADPLELIHCHMVRPVLFPEECQLDIPAPVKAILKKLMAKNAEDRYQSALGLAYDIMKCLKQLDKTGAIVAFELGTHDVCDRFLIPEKLYGRDREVQCLLSAFERVTTGHSTLVLVAGYSGIGKTAVVNEIHKPIAQQKGYFIRGKFEQFNDNIPLSGFVQALQGLVRQLLGMSESVLQEWKAKILDVVSINGQVLIDVIPDLERVIGPQPPLVDLGGAAALNRFNLLLTQFIHLFATHDHPLVVFLDDLQWADSASLQLLKLLLGNESSGCLLIIGAYRDNEVFAAHPLMLTLKELEDRDTAIETVTLAPLQQEDFTGLVADTLLCQQDTALPLAELVYQKTQGNPFFATQFLVELHSEGLIVFDVEARGWRCDLTPVRQLALTDDVVVLLMNQLQKLPQNTQRMLQMAACMGSYFDLNTLAILDQSHADEVSTSLWAALRAGLVIPENETYKFFQARDCDDSAVASESAQQLRAQDIAVRYRFLHDRVQQAAYTCIPDDDKATTHHRVGTLLLDHTPTSRLDDAIFAIVSQLNLAQELVVSSHGRGQLIELNLKAAKKARLSSAYEAALQFCQIGLKHLDARVWNEQYEMVRDLHLEAANAASLTGAFELADRCLQELLDRTPQIVERVQGISIKIQSLIARNQLTDAIQLARDTLTLVGVDLPTEATADAVDGLTAEIERKLANTGNILHLGRMTEANALAATNILSSMASAAYIGAPELYPIVVLKQIELSLAHGYADETAYAFSTYGLILCAFGGNSVAGNAAADIALELAERSPTRVYHAKILNLVYAFVRVWKDPIRMALEPLLEGYRTGVDNGDFEFAAYCAMNHCKLAYLSGQNLQDVCQHMETYGNSIAHLKQSTALTFHNITHQVALNWMDDESEPYQLAGPIYDESEQLPQHEAAGDAYSVGSVYLHKAILAYHFAGPDVVMPLMQMATQHLGSVAGTADVGMFTFYRALAHVGQGVAVDDDFEQLAGWSQRAPATFSHRCLLLQAERCRYAGDRAQAIDLYDRAIAEARQNQYVQEEALANELAALFYLDWGKDKIASSYMMEAYYCYARWGGHAKVAALESQYPDLLTLVLEASKRRHNTLAQSMTSADTLTTTNFSTDQVWVDLSAFIKASQAISQELEWDQLLNTLMRNATATAGAEVAQLVLQTDDQWMVVARTDGHCTQLCQIPLAEAQDLPQSLVRNVLRTNNTVLFDDLSNVIDYAADPYVQQHQPKSVFCTALIQKRKPIGALYLQSNISTGVFAHDRIETVKLLMSQAAISLEISQLYRQQETYSQNLEREVAQKTKALRDKTQDLEQALELLQETNRALLRTSKLKDEFLASMSHELRTPLNSILGFAKVLQEGIYGEINGKQQNALNIVSKSGTHLLELINDILDLAKVESGKLELTYSRASIEEICTASLSFIKQQSHQKQIQVKLDIAPQLSTLRVDERRIRQVLINLLNNAVKFTGEGGVITLQVTEEHRPPAFESETSQSMFSDELSEPNRPHWVRFCVIDTGIGISPSNLQKLFKPFIQIDSALNRKYSGTGLGLSLVKRIIELHGGQVGVTSQEGVGSQFWFELPYLPIVEELSAPADDEPDEDTFEPDVLDTVDGCPRILLAEDNPANVATVSAYLEAKGYTILLAQDGREAITMTEREKPDAILMDIQMPEVDGLEAIRHIRNELGLKDLPIIALTAMAMRGDREKCMEAGASDYLSKPVQLKQLHVTLQQLMGAIVS